MNFEKGTDYKLTFTNEVDRLINIKPLPTAMRNTSGMSLLKMPV